RCRTFRPAPAAFLNRRLQRARKVNKDGESPSPHSLVTPCGTKNIFSSFSGHPTKRPVPVLFVKYANPWSILEKSDFFSNWRPTFKSVRTYFIDNSG
ncbi:hypothetical protein ACFLS1_11705, partial [Verrucomicrobiota bacterium]